MWHQQVFALDAKYNAQRVNKLPTLGLYMYIYNPIYCNTLRFTND